MKISSTFKVRQIKPENICIGDTVRWTTKAFDLTISRVGTLHHKDIGKHNITFYTRESEVIGVWWLDRTKRDTITLLQPAPQNTDIEIERYDELQKVVKENG